MNYKKTINLFLIPALFLLIHGCSKEKSSSTPPPSSEAPDLSPNASNLESFAVNTFSSSGYSITVDNTTLNFGTDLTLGETTSKEFTLYNNSSQTLTFTLNIYCTSGSFRFNDEEEDTNAAYLPDITIAAGGSKTFTVEFDAKRLGETSGYVTITTSQISEAQIKIPLYALIPSAAEMQVIPSSYLCGSENASTVETVDFGSVPVGLDETKSIKICNVGGETFEIYSVTISTDSSGEVSKVFTRDTSVDKYTFAGEIKFLTEELYGFPGYFKDVSYDSPPELSIEDSIVNQTSAFGIVDYTTQTTPENLIIDDGEYSKLDITFTPPTSLGLEATDTQLYLAPFAAELTISTSLGDKTITLLGASGGVEPSLAISYSFTTTNEEGTETTTSGDVDLTSSGAAIDFGTLSKFSDWILEEGREVTVTLKNVGTKGPLKVWPDGLTEDEGGFFTLKDDGTLEFPLEIEAGSSKDITLVYLPTEEEVSDSIDIGQLILHHNGGNGPTNSIMLAGKQEETKAITASVEGKTLKTSYTGSNRKNLCNTDIGGVTTKTFTITNNSSKFNLKPSVTLSRFISDGEGGTVFGAKATLDTTNLTSEGGVIAPKSSGTFTLNIKTSSGVAVGTTLNGKVTIQNEYENESTYEREAQDYDIYYTAQATEDGVCNLGTANAPDGNIQTRASRIAMIMAGLAEPLRTYVNNMLNIKTYADAENGYVIFGGIEYDPATDKDKPNYKKFQSYNHQGSNVQSCFPLLDNVLATPTDSVSNNPKGYKAWNDPDSQFVSTDEDFPVEEGTICMPDKGAELEVDEDGNSVYVFYHYFIKFGDHPMKGKIATFYYPKETTALAQYKQMEEDIGSEASLEEYMAYERTGGFGSYITFDEKISLPNCTYEAGTITDSDAIMDCWDAFKDPGNGIVLQRNTGMVETCSYFHFGADKGCAPQDSPTAERLRSEGDPNGYICEDSSITIDDPDTWKGFGEYKPHIIDPDTEEESETQMDITFRGVTLYGAFLSYSLNNFYTNNSKLMFVELHATLTTKPIGNDYNGTADPDWQDLIAPENRIYATKDMVYKDINSTFARENFIEDGINGYLNVTEDGDDTKDCFDSSGNPLPMTTCKGSYLISSDKKYIMTAGEPMRLEYKNRGILTGLTVFTANGQMAPTFATGGKPITFIIPFCFINEEDPDESIGCYEEDWVLPDEVMEAYYDLGYIDSPYKDDDLGDPRAKINFRPIYPRDYDQFTNYWNAPDNFHMVENYYSTGTTCGYGM